MGRRTSAGRSVPGNPMGGVLRSMQRASRAPSRVPRVAPPEPVAAATAAATPVAAVVHTGTDGVAHFVFPATYAETPVVVATVAATYPATAVVKWVTPAATALRVYCGSGAAVAEGVAVHVAVFPAA